MGAGEWTALCAAELTRLLDGGEGLDRDSQRTLAAASRALECWGQRLTALGARLQEAAR